MSLECAIYAYIHSQGLLGFCRPSSWWPVAWSRRLKWRLLPLSSCWSLWTATCRSLSHIVTL